jgi:hypothetical protein
VAAVFAYALRRTSARAVLAVGAFGLLWALLFAQEYGWNVGEDVLAAAPTLRGSYLVLGVGFSPWDAAAAAVAAVVAVAAAAVLWRERWDR